MNEIFYFEYLIPQTYNHLHVEMPGIYAWVFNKFNHMDIIYIYFM